MEERRSLQECEDGRRYNQMMRQVMDLASREGILCKHVPGSKLEGLDLEDDGWHFAASAKASLVRIIEEVLAELTNDLEEGACMPGCH
eukprot:11185861-Alexandrium_andersonii.AAC.1